MITDDLSPGPYGDLQDITCPVWGCCFLVNCVWHVSGLQLFGTRFGNDSLHKVSFSSTNVRPRESPLLCFLSWESVWYFRTVQDDPSPYPILPVILTTVNPSSHRSSPWSLPELGEPHLTQYFPSSLISPLDVESSWPKIWTRKMDRRPTETCLVHSKELKLYQETVYFY